MSLVEMTETAWESLALIIRSTRFHVPMLGLNSKMSSKPFPPPKDVKLTYNSLITITVTCYLSLSLSGRCSLLSVHREELGALQNRSTWQSSPPAAPWRRARHYHPSRQWRGVSERWWRHKNYYQYLPWSPPHSQSSCTHDPLCPAVAGEGPEWILTRNTPRPCWRVQGSCHLQSVEQWIRG